MRTRLTAALGTALKEGKRHRVNTLRLMLAAIKDKDIEARGSSSASLTEADMQALFVKMVKQRTESASLYELAGRLDLADREREEIVCIREFLPEIMDEDESVAAVKDAIEETEAENLRDIGKVMNLLKERYGTRLDMSAAGKIAKDIFASGDKT